MKNLILATHGTELFGETEKDLLSIRGISLLGRQEQKQEIYGYTNKQQKWANKLGAAAMFLSVIAMVTAAFMGYNNQVLWLAAITAFFVLLTLFTAPGPRTFYYPDILVVKFEEDLQLDGITRVLERYTLYKGKEPGTYTLKLQDEILRDFAKKKKINLLPSIK